MRKEAMFLIIFLSVIPVVMAGEGHTSLLAVREATNEGSVADLYLEIRPGSGRVFIETIPLSKMDTQISTRFAKDIACDYLERDCSQYDFFYTIKAGAPIIGGPSAGASTAVLTAVVLEGIEIDEDVSITGTINSGNVVGPVGGLTAKIEAASAANIKTVLIPKGERFLKELNLTVDLVDYAKNLNIAVVEVGDLTDALYYFTGKRFKERIFELEMDDDYINTMKVLAEELCDRTEGLGNKFSELDLDISLIDEDVISDEENAIELKDKGEKAFEEEMYYSAASRCFGANVKYNGLLLKFEGYDNLTVIENEIKDLEFEIGKVPIETITDLQAYMVVRERLRDAVDSFVKAKVAFDEGEDYATELAYAIERIYSAKSWSRFFSVEGKRFKFDRESLKQGCLNKISEAEERYHYAKFYFPTTLEATKEDLEYAKDDYNNGDFELCLFKASKVKAEADVVLSVVGVAEDQMDAVFDNKLEAVKRVIAEQQEKNIFPILGYSYYEYASYLKEENIMGALVYSEYALELSNLDIYFNKERKFRVAFVDREKLMLLLGGIVLGVMAVLLIKKKGVKVKKKKRLF
ncbi:hypothetical protein KY332_03770 [Candidatus Woesearchaeota archaeon]|nr:hypothetical protein [Candidatus Woesearchaeota archaeon]